MRVLLFLQPWFGCRGRTGEIPDDTFFRSPPLPANSARHFVQLFSFFYRLFSRFVSIHFVLFRFSCFCCCFFYSFLDLEMWIKTWHWNLNINLIHKYAGRAAKGSGGKRVGRKIWWAASEEKEREATREELWDDCRKRRTEIAIVSRSLWLSPSPQCRPTPLPSIALFRTLCLQQLHADSNNNNNNNNSFVSRSYPAACLFGLLFAAPRAPLRRTSPRRLLRLFLTSTAENFQFLVFSLFWTAAASA